MAWRIEAIDTETAPEHELRMLYDLHLEIHDELWSEDPREPFELWKKDVTEVPSWRRTLRWAVWSDDRARALALATLSMGFTETNRHLADFDVTVRREVRRRGAGLQLLAPVVAAAEAEGRTLLEAGAPTDTPGTAFLDAVGAETKIVERKSRMVVADVDRAMLELWVERAAERAAGYSLLAWDGPVPEEYLERFVDLQMVMNTAPRDDREVDDWVHTPQRQRENEERYARKGETWWTLVARHDATDGLVGYTEFVFPPHDPTVVWQEATVVDPTHRDRGIGRWLKAVNCLRLMDERPDVRYVDTWNAFSNAPMLGINNAMGFQVVKSYSDYQIPTERLAAALKERRGS
ncbi:MAG: GNAT family N-acetyltransferase [Actinobacteria bacterium]|nr:GNAT family N-acetyltransferase [Actinomycetota bacterium]